jgi:hypothetical protein
MMSGIVRGPILTAIVKDTDECSQECEFLNRQPDPAGRLRANQSQIQTGGR